MTRNLWVVRAPESPNRPEKYIADNIIEGLKLHPRLENWDIKEINPNPVNGKDPLQGKMFYDNHTFKTNFTQALKDITQKVKTGDSILFIEGLNPLISFLNYWFFVENKRVNMFGIFHSSSYTPGDLFYGNNMIRRMEAEAAISYKRLFIATDYLGEHVSLIRDGAQDFPYCETVGLPLPKSLLTEMYKFPSKPVKQVMWSHRWADDKNKQVFLDLAQGMPDYQFTILSPNSMASVPSQDIEVMSTRTNIQWMQCVEHQEYLDYLRTSKGFFFSSATLETFGYSFLEALGHGWYPIVPNYASYKEMTGRQNKYAFDPKKLHQPAYYENLLVRIEGMIRKATEKGFGDLKPLDTLIPRFVDTYGRCEQLIGETIANEEVHSETTNGL